MRRPSFPRVIRSGFVATLVMTIMLYLSPSMVPPRMDIAALFGRMLGGSWWLGLIIHFTLGAIIFSLLYAYLLNPLLPSKPWTKGTLWGLTLWLVAQMLILPMIGMGFFSADIPRRVTAVLGSLLAHLIYGIVLGALLKPSVSREVSATPTIQKLHPAVLSMPGTSSGEMPASIVVFFRRQLRGSR